MERLVIIGAGDFGREVANVAVRINEASDTKIWDIIGFIDDNPEIQGKKIDGYPVLGTTDDLNKYSEEVYAICTLGVSKTRKKVLDKIKNPLVKFATLIDPDARVYHTASVDEGTIVCGGSIIHINTRIGKHVVVNINCTTGHDAIIEDYSVINPGTNISGKVTVHTCSDLGTGAKVIQGLQIGPNTTVGAGGVVVRDIPENCLAVGCPAKVIKQYTKV